MVEDKYYRIIICANYCGYDNEYLFCGSYENAAFEGNEIAAEVTNEMGETDEGEEEPYADADIEEITKEEFDKYLEKDGLEVL